MWRSRLASLIMFGAVRAATFPGIGVSNLGATSPLSRSKRARRSPMRKQSIAFQFGVKYDRYETEGMTAEDIVGSRQLMELPPNRLRRTAAGRGPVTTWALNSQDNRSTRRNNI